jgi:hypothetical protein
MTLLSEELIACDVTESAHGIHRISTPFWRMYTMSIVTCVHAQKRAWLSGVYIPYMYMYIHLGLASLLFGFLPYSSPFSL